MEHYLVLAMGSLLAVIRPPLCMTSSAARGATEASSTAPTPSELEESAHCREQEQLEAFSSRLATLCASRQQLIITRAEKALADEFGHEVFPRDFPWHCGCSEKGFPGCGKVEHFLQRVALAITDFYQVKAAGNRPPKPKHQQERGVRLDRFPGSLRDELRQAMDRAVTIVACVIDEATTG